MPIFYGVVAGPYASLGTAPAQSGTVRIPNAGTISALNAAGSADRQLVQLSASNELALADSQTVTRLQNDARPQTTDAIDLGTTALAFRTLYVSGGVDFTAKDATTTESIVAGTANGLKIGTGATQKLGFYGHATTAQQTGVAVTAAGIHAACVALGLFTA